MKISGKLYYVLHIIVFSVMGVGDLVIDLKTSSRWTEKGAQER